MEHSQKTQGKENASEIFRPNPGAFPPLEKARAYRGELVFVDHANRRGSLRIQTANAVRFNSPHPFALLPYAVVRYRGAPADLRDIPLGTVLHARAFLPPDPATSPVPVLPHKRDDSAAPRENHVILLEDEASNCLREGEVWMLKEVELRKDQGLIVAVRRSKSGGEIQSGEESMTFDDATRIWRGRECLGIADLIAEGTWPGEGTKSLGGQAVLLGLSWLPAGTWENRVENQFHLTDLWLDDAAMDRCTRIQTGLHKSLIRTRLMPARVDGVEYGEFGRATVTATLFGGMDESLYADFKKGVEGVMAAAENTLKPWSSIVSSSHIASKGRLLEVTRTAGEPPFGSSGIQIRFETDLIIEGIRPGRVVRVRPASWPHVSAPREEYLIDHRSGLDDRFPTPAIFPKY